MPPLSERPEAEGKGTNFVGTLRSLEQLRGRAVHDEVVAALEGPFGEALRHGQVLPVGWYPAPWFVQLQRTIQHVTGEGLPLTRELARASCERDFTGLHRVLVRLLSPQTVAGQTHRIMQLYWRGGDVAVVESTSDRVLLRFDGWKGFDLVVWEDLAASMEAIIRIVGASSVRAWVTSTKAQSGGAEIEARFG